MGQFSTRIPVCRNTSMTAQAQNACFSARFSGNSSPVSGSRALILPASAWGRSTPLKVLPATVNDCPGGCC